MTLIEVLATSFYLDTLHAIQFSLNNNVCWNCSIQVGPRFCLNPIKIFGGSFGGPTWYENPYYISPNQVC